MLCLCYVNHVAPILMCICSALAATALLTNPMLCLCYVNHFAPILMRICIALAATLLLTNLAYKPYAMHMLCKSFRTISDAYLHCYKLQPQLQIQLQLLRLELQFQLPQQL